MNYEFPEINHITEVLEAIEPVKDNFIVAYRARGGGPGHDYIIINYILPTNEAFPEVKTREHALRRECRGIIFDAFSGKVISRRMHKFWNVGQRFETLPENIDFSKGKVILQKLDGSFITPFQTLRTFPEDPILWGTKMGETDTATMIKPFLDANPHYEQFARRVISSDFTPTFEFCSRKNRIVIDHGTEDRLVLINIRDNVTGKYVSYDHMTKIAEANKIEYVLEHPSLHLSLEELINDTRAMEGMEGWVVRFDDGHMLKIKSDWYCAIHSAKELIESERHVVKAILTNGLDDLIGILPPLDKDRVVAYQERFVPLYLADSIGLFQLVCFFRNKHADRKSFAINDAPICAPLVRMITFKLWDEEVTLDKVRAIRDQHIINACDKESKFQAIKKTEFPDMEY